MWAKLLKLALTDERVRKLIVGTVVSLIFTVIMLLYALLATPWAMLTGQFDDLFAADDPNSVNMDESTRFDDGGYAMLGQDKYIENFEQYLDDFRGALNGPYRNEWGATYDLAQELADEIADEKEDEYEELDDACSVSATGYTVIYSTFGSAHMYGQDQNDTDELGRKLTSNVFVNRLSEAESGIPGGIDDIRINDGAAALSVYNNVGLMWKCYADSHSESDNCKICPTIPADVKAGMKNILDEMQVPKDPNTGEYLGSLATVDSSEVVTLIKRNAASFFQGHVPDGTGLCFPGTKPVYMQLTWDDDTDELPRSFADLHNKTYRAADGIQKNFEEPYTGIYWSVKKEECGCNDDDDEDNDHSTTHYDYTINVTVVGYVEYKGYSWFEDHLYLNYFPKSRGYVDEAYRNLIDIVGGEALNNKKLGEYSLGLDSLFKGDAEDRGKPENAGARDYFFGDGGQTLLPVVDADGNAFRISARFHDPNYVADLTHWGVDFAAPGQTPIRATTDGQVVRVGSDPDGFGNYAAIYQGKNSAGDRYYCIYAHMFAPPNVREGDPVSAGQQIGLVGTSGFSTGNHLHYEIRVVRVDGTTTSIDPFSEEGGLTLG